MKRSLLLPLLTPVLLLAGCNQEPEGQPVLRTEIGSGVAEDIPGQAPQNKADDTGAIEETEQSERASVCRDVTFEQVLLTHCTADPAIHRIVTALSGADGKPYRSLSKLASSRGADAKSVAFAVNGGMFNGEGKPIGYYVQNRNRTKELNRSDGPGNFHLMPNGVFFGTGGTWQVHTSDYFYRMIGDRPDFGTQSGPMLVIDGKLHPKIADNGPSKAIRNGVGIGTDGRAHFVIANAPLSFGVLARFYRDELKVPNALFLDGNVSALWDPATGRMDAGAALGPLIVIENRE
ncbi:MAG: phosphodiester glycosidase family protein [Pontixanthobacter sp.]